MLINEIWKIVENDEIKDKKIIFFGASTRNIVAINELDIADRVLFFVDSNPQKSGTMLDGYKIFSLNKIEEFSECIIVSVLTQNMLEVLERVREVGNNQCYFYIHERYNTCCVSNENRIVLNKRSSYKYVHIFTNEKFIRFFYAMVEEKFEINEHLFIVEYQLTDKDSGAFDYEDIKHRNKRNNNILILDSVHDGIEYLDGEENCNKIFESEKLHKIFEGAEKIILHSAFWRSNGKKLVQSLVEQMNNKVAWICWGGDSYFERDSDVVKNILNKVKHAYATKEPTVRIKNVYEIPVKCTNIIYTYTSLNKQICMNSIKENFDRSDTIYILLGHSAAEYGNHQFGLELLKKYKDENIRIFCPLSYGSEIYRNQVIKTGKEMFGDKFVPMLKFMEHNVYCEFLNTIDVAVFPMTRVAAGTTLNYLNAIGTKIYMSIEMINNFSNLNLKAKNILDIEKNTFEEFVTHSVLDIEKRLENIKKLNNRVVTEWKKIIEDKWEGEYDTI